MLKYKYAQTKDTDKRDTEQNTLTTNQSVAWDNIVELDPHLQLDAMIHAVIAYLKCHKETKLSDLAQRLRGSGLNTCLLTWSKNEQFLKSGKYKLAKQWSDGEDAEYEFVISCRPRELAWKEMLDSCNGDWDENKRRLDLAGHYIACDDDTVLKDGEDAGMRIVELPKHKNNENTCAGSDINDPFQAINNYERIKAERMSTQQFFPGLLDETKYDNTVFDNFLRRNLFVSGVLFLLVQAVYLLLTRYQFSVITLVGRVVQIQVVVFFLYIVLARIIKNTSEGSIVLPLTDFKVSKELLEPYVHAIVEKFNSLVSCYVDILVCKDLLKTIQFIAVVQLVCIVGKKVEGLNFAYALLNILFVVPFIYEWQQEKIDGVFKQAWAKVKQLLDQALTKEEISRLKSLLSLTT